MALKVLINISNWNKQLMPIIASAMAKDIEFKKISNMQELDETNVINNFEKYKKNKLIISHYLSDENTFDILSRDRILRNMSFNKSYKIIQYMRKSICEFLDYYQPKILISGNIDNFFHDILVRECILKNIIVFTPNHVFINGYISLMLKGSRIKLREPLKNEIDYILNTLVNDRYTSNYIISAKKNVYYTYIKNWLFDNLRCIFFGIIDNCIKKQFNYHYQCHKFIKFYSQHYFPQYPTENLNWKVKLNQSRKIKLFIPLQFYPESTIDYWIKDREAIDYEDYLINMLSKLTNDFTFIIKEHPCCIGHRKPTFYKRIKKTYPEIIFVPIKISSNECIYRSDCVLVSTGTVGFEAALRGKPVLTLGKPYYVFGNRFLNINKNTALKDIIQFIQKNKYNELKCSEQADLIKFTLEGFIKGVFRNDGSFNIKDPNHIKEATSLGQQLFRLFSIHKDYLLNMQKRILD